MHDVANQCNTLGGQTRPGVCQRWVTATAAATQCWRFAANQGNSLGGQTLGVCRLSLAGWPVKARSVCAVWQQGPPLTCAGNCIHHQQPPSSPFRNAVCICQIIACTEQTRFAWARSHSVTDTALAAGAVQHLCSDWVAWSTVVMLYWCRSIYAANVQHNIYLLSSCDQADG